MAELAYFKEDTMSKNKLRTKKTIKEQSSKRVISPKVTAIRELSDQRQLFFLSGDN
jgi:hypothetical protein